MSLDTQLHKLPPHLRVKYISALPEIRQFQRIGHELRQKFKLEPLVEHNALTREMHEVEVECLKFLVPDLKARDPNVKLKAIKWLCRQDWGKDFRASPYDKRYFPGHGLTNTQK